MARRRSGRPRLSDAARKTEVVKVRVDQRVLRLLARLSHLRQESSSEILRAGLEALEREEAARRG